MPTQVTEFKCPACTAPLHFSEETGRLECDYCGSSFTVAEAEAFSAEKEQQAAEAFEKAAAEAKRLAAEQAEAARLAAEAAQADEKSWADQVDDPDFVFAWWMIPVALGTFALGGGIVLLSLHSAARRRKKYTGKFVRK